ncbi:MAG TPA: glycoside hydrolase family 3 N-terminal domain-containing protein [Kofleriaceae bacterium]|nr:glycoside hydrolase family 3 N-terminal domain-containing protein [Kofleriaceae bacterium]
MRNAAIASLLAVVASCSAQDDEYVPTGAPDETDSTGEGGKEDSPAPGPEVPVAQQSADIGQFFMVDHYGVDAAGFADIRNKIKTKNLGAIILWNPTNASGETLRQMIRGYSDVAKAAGRDELFYAADQEELRTQRFASANGFTSLVQGSVLGSVSSRDRLCELHARITSREMASTGMNMSLGTVSDIYTSDSGTRGMFRTRAIDDQPENVASCVVAMTKAYAQEGHVVYITKHFPGLGNASGNTDVDASVATRSKTKAAMERELAPYRAASASVTAANGWPFFGAMISHASYPVIDGGALPATLSSKIVNDFMRGTGNLTLGGKDSAGAATTFAGMGFRGLSISDAFWTWGATRGLTPVQRQRLMARAFLAGVDILMISKVDFTGAWGYFQEVYANMLPAAEQQALLAATGIASWDELRAKFKARITESAARIRSVKAKVGLSTSFMKTGPATAASTDLVGEYRRLAN